MWSVLGCAILPGTITARPTGSIHGGTPELLNRLGFRKQHIFSIEDSLFQLGEEHLTPWRKLGYTPLDTRLFWHAGADYAIIPVQLLHPQLGVLESCTLHFTKPPTGIWTYSGSLSGFHLEAINKASSEVAQQGTDSAYHRQLLLPIVSIDHKVVKGAYLTALGSFEFKAKINNDRTFVVARLKKADKTVWEAEYLSDHMRKGETSMILA